MFWGLVFSNKDTEELSQFSSVYVGPRSIFEHMGGTPSEGDVHLSEDGIWPRVSTYSLLLIW